MLTGMEFPPSQAPGTEVVDTVGGGCGASVCIEAVDVAGQSEEQLRARISWIGRAESKLAAMKSQAVAEMARQHNAVNDLCAWGLRGWKFHACKHICSE